MRGVIQTEGAISDYRSLRDICKHNKGDCRNCQLGDQERLEDTLCPRLTPPRSWTNEKTAEMVRAISKLKTK